MKGIFDADLQRTDTVTIKAPFGELCISEVDIQLLLNNLKERFVFHVYCLRRFLPNGSIVLVGVIRFLSSI